MHRSIAARAAWALSAPILAYIIGGGCAAPAPAAGESRPGPAATGPAATQVLTVTAPGGFVASGGRGRRIVFVCDASDAMAGSFDDERAQLHKAIEPLKPSVTCNIVFIRNDAATLEGGCLPMVPENKRRLLKFVDGFQPRGAADPKPALKAAFAMQPELVFLLVNPEGFTDRKELVELCRTLNPGPKKAKINTICFKSTDPEGVEMLKQISDDSGGTYRRLSKEELAEDDAPATQPASAGDH